MTVKVSVFTTLLLLQSLRMQASPTLSPAEIEALYNKANTFFTLSHPTTLTDAKALSLFDEVIIESETSHATEEVLFQSYVKKGVLLDVKGYYLEAVGAYAGALRCMNRHADWNDSLSFPVYIYSGADYYKLDNFDSAYSMLNRAELLADKFPGLHERDRLYNALGALYYESGNYLQGKNYFSRALKITVKERPDDKISAINYESNIASCLYKLGSYRESLDIYSHLIHFGQSSSQLYLNMGKANVGLNDYAQALALYRKVRPSEVPGVYNEMAYAQFLLGKKDSALIYLNRWQSTNPSQQTKIDAGINALYRAQVLIAMGQDLSAVGFLQQAIITFSGTFKDPVIQDNPVNFVGSFASYRLFDALAYKARELEILYRDQGKQEYLLAALQAYNSAIILFRYIEKTYTTDDAKLFLKKNNRDLYQHAFLICLELNRLQPGGPYLEEAFLMAEKSKASIISGSVDQMAYGKMPGIDPALLQRQKDIKYNIARLELKSDPERGMQVTQAIANQKADYEIELSSIQKSMEGNNAYYKMKFEDTCPTVKELQSGLPANEAIISLFVTDTGCHVFTLTSNAFHYFLIDSLPMLTRLVKGWTDMLDNTGRGQRFGNKWLEAQLLRRLVSPLLKDLKGKDNWTIIPDGIFYLLPFESLPLDANEHALIETTTVSYQLSAKFLAAPFRKGRDKVNTYSVLSFAPFSSAGEWVNTNPVRFMERLPGSGQEIGQLPGKQFRDEQATKAHFLEEMNHFAVIHLATHALADPQNKQSSLICFYPQGKGSEDDCLFLPELYALNLDNTDLIILSTCESGKGEIVDNEGIMSLSRGFMYAGCASTVNSLWKADDASTTSILKQFHVYLEKGYTKSAALRRAKLDFMHSNAVYITPNFWAHLILIGNTDAIVEKKEVGVWEGWMAGSYLFIFILSGVLGLIISGTIVIWRARSSYLKRSSS